MDDLRYDPPKAVVADAPAHGDGERGIVPAAVLQRIRNAWIACLVSAAVTLVVALAAMAGRRVGPFGAAQLIDVVLIVLLAFGISRKSRTCAVLMFLYFVVSKVWLISMTGQFNGVFLGLAFLYFYAMGVVGTVQYHKLRKG